MNHNRHTQRGATSLFIVLFSTLLFTVITVGFLGLMTSDQRRAIDSEWSEGAYDAALAGVEDGKRVLAMCRDSNDRDSQACQAIKAESCDTIESAGLVTAVNGEVLIQSQSIGAESEPINQAYTCVVIKRDNPSYVGSLDPDESVLIPLDAGNADYDAVRIQWFTREDAGNSATATFTNGAAGGGVLTPPLPKLSEWSSDGTRPPIMRTQFMQYDGGDDVELNDFNRNKFAHTTFLYPSAAGASSIKFAGSDVRSPNNLKNPSDKSSPVRTACSSGIPSTGYTCTMEIELPEVDDREALLRLTALYQSTTYQVQMIRLPNTIVNFVDTLPSVDSTGRSGDVFRRVNARIDMGGAASDATVPYPRAAIDTTKSLCKNMMLGATNSSWVCGP